ncbi:MAG: di-heme oxidoredictase family protein, partial [Myxococcota bacterium]
LTFGRIHDNDDVPDPELSLADAADLAFYLATLAPPPRTPADDPSAAAAGEGVFDDVGCTGCHVPALGGVPLYSDLLLHDILEEGALGIEEASATMTEFRTAPLWGIAQTAPYLHDGSADTLDDAIRAHAGESTAARDAYTALPASDREALRAFLETL